MNTHPGPRPRKPIRLERHDNAYWQVMVNAYKRRLKVWEFAEKNCRRSGLEGKRS